MRNNILIFTVIASLLLFQTSTTVSAIAPPPGGITYHIHGCVAFEGPLQGATVKFYVDGVYKGSVTTDSNGLFSKYVTVQVAVLFKITIIKSGYVTKTVTKEESGENIDFGTVNLSIIYTISGTAKVTQTLQGIEGASVDLFYGSISGWTFIKQVTTGVGGYFSTTYTRSSSIILCKAEVTAEGYEDGLKVVDVTGPNVPMGDITLSLGPDPIVTVEVINILEKQATLVWDVIYWGIDGQGQNPFAEINYKTGTSSGDWDVTDVVAFSEWDDPYYLTGLVMGTQYTWNINLKHTISGNVETLFTSEGTFWSEEWIPSTKYAIVIDLNGDVNDGGYDAHANAYDDMLELLHSGDGDDPIPPQDWEYDDIYHPASALQSESGFISALTHFSSVTNPDSFLFIYLVGHGRENDLGLYYGASRIWINKTTIAAAIDSYDGDNLPGKMVIVIEACFSGSLIDVLAAEDRVIITASDGDQEAGYNPNNDTCWFSNLFISKLYNHGTLYYAFYETAYYIDVQGWESGGDGYQNPLIYDCQTASIYGVGYDDSDIRIGYHGQLAAALSLMIVNG